ncbi:reverse transcriptase [Phytophthora megakarya]|uniref:Reverse transcriptase n=1 Tax=Phytophthora megakarya TaxID=4795 RepID=A0A225VH91_9STRA|nr:reverse transcriptase [Phytophthora megakarya]
MTSRPQPLQCLVPAASWSSRVNPQNRIPLPLPQDWDPGPRNPNLVGERIQFGIRPIDAQVTLARSFVMAAMATERLDAEPAVYYHQGFDFVLLDKLKNQLVYLPDLWDLRPEANIEDAIVGKFGESDPEEEEMLREILRKHRMICLGVVNALPPGPGSSVYELPKRLLETGLVEYSNSEWASVIVLVMKKNGTDISLCIDYRLKLIKLVNYP